jgi:hypothetical protein
VLKFLSVNSIVIAPANTGNDNNSNIAVTDAPQTNKGILNKCIPGVLILNTVVRKLIEPNNDDKPAK